MEKTIEQIFTPLRLLVSKIDQKVAFHIDKMHKQQKKLRRTLQLEQELEEKLSTLEDISKSLSSKEVVQLNSFKVQLQWMLDQIRGKSG